MASFLEAFFRLFVLEFRLFVWRVSLFRLFTWRYFVFSHGVILPFRLFAWRLFFFSFFSRGVISGRKDEKTKWHIPATILKRPLAFLDVIYQHVHRMLKSRHIKDWCTQSWSMVVQFGTPQVEYFNRNLRRYRKGQLDL